MAGGKLQQHQQHGGLAGPAAGHPPSWVQEYTSAAGLIPDTKLDVQSTASGCGSAQIESLCARQDSLAPGDGQKGLCCR